MENNNNVGATLNVNWDSLVQQFSEQGAEVLTGDPIWGNGGWFQVRIVETGMTQGKSYNTQLVTDRLWIDYVQTSNPTGRKRRVFLTVGMQLEGTQYAQGIGTKEESFLKDMEAMEKDLKKVFYWFQSAGFERPQNNTGVLHGTEVGVLLSAPKANSNGEMKQYVNRTCHLAMLDREKAKYDQALQGSSTPRTPSFHKNPTPPAITPSSPPSPPQSFQSPVAQPAQEQQGVPSAPAAPSVGFNGGLRPPTFPATQTPQIQNQPATYGPETPTTGAGYGFANGGAGASPNELPATGDASGNTIAPYVEDDVPFVTSSMGAELFSPRFRH
jgi:hypothetical protein